MPHIEIAQSAVIRIASAEFSGVNSRKADEYEPVGFKERFDFRQGQLVFLHMEEEVAAFAGTEKIRELSNVLHRRAILLREDVLAAAANVFDRVAVAAL